MALPNKVSGGARRDFTPAPKIGQHSVDILRESGYSENEINALLESGATLDGRIKKQ
jgi:crotonobetainyl-CoA:carnitine CoA-transferase CaiB-like acyl-CoA transferase